MTRPVYLALVHYPVKDKVGDVITTSVTNLDVHDIARSVRTYGLSGYFICTPITAQHAILERILSHWRPGAKGADRIPKRSEALQMVRPARFIEDAAAAIEQEHGVPPRIWVTGAKAPVDKAVLSFSAAQTALQTGAPTLLVFGTGHGLTHETVVGADAVLAPIRAGRYNHLSVRAAVAIILDRLFGET